MKDKHWMSTIQFQVGLLRMIVNHRLCSNVTKTLEQYVCSKTSFLVMWPCINLATCHSKYRMNRIGDRTNVKDYDQSFITLTPTCAYIFQSLIWYVSYYWKDLLGGHQAYRHIYSVLLASPFKLHRYRIYSWWESNMCTDMASKLFTDLVIIPSMIHTSLWSK